MEKIKFVGKEEKAVVFTESAVLKLKQVIKEKGKKDYGIRIIMDGGGCSGHSYQMGLENKKQDDDKIIESNGLKVYMDPMSYMNINKMKVDYIKTENEEGFSIDNGEEKSEGSCGSGGCGSGGGCCG